MGKRFVLSDDLTGNETDDVKNHLFMLDNVFYEVDLSADSFAAFEKDIAKYLKVMRETRRITATAKGEASDAEKIRQWAKANGYEVSERGRMAAEVIDAYAKAHSNGAGNDSSAEDSSGTNPDETDTPKTESESAQEAPESTP